MFYNGPRMCKIDCDRLECKECHKCEVAADSAAEYLGAWKMGPTCPHCGNSVEWCVGEIWEDIYADKTYTCAKCYGIFCVALETLLAEQKSAQASLVGPPEEDTYNTKPEDVEWTPPDSPENEDE